MFPYTAKRNVFVCESIFVSLVLLGTLFDLILAFRVSSNVPRCSIYVNDSSNQRRTTPPTWCFSDDTVPTRRTHRKAACLRSTFRSWRNNSRSRRLRRVSTRCHNRPKISFCPAMCPLWPSATRGREPSSRKSSRLSTVNGTRQTRLGIKPSCVVHLKRTAHASTATSASSRTGSTSCAVLTGTRSTKPSSVAPTTQSVSVRMVRDATSYTTTRRSVSRRATQPADRAPCPAWTRPPHLPNSSTWVSSSTRALHPPHPQGTAVTCSCSTKPPISPTPRSPCAATTNTTRCRPSRKTRSPPPTVRSSTTWCTNNSSRGWDRPTSPCPAVHSSLVAVLTRSHKAPSMPTFNPSKHSSTRGATWRPPIAARRPPPRLRTLWIRPTRGCRCSASRAVVVLVVESLSHIGSYSTVYVYTLWHISIAGVLSFSPNS